jgi:hypothetical protein
MKRLKSLQKLGNLKGRVRFGTLGFGQNIKKDLIGLTYENVDWMKLLWHAGQIRQRHCFAYGKDVFLFGDLKAEIISRLLFGVSFYYSVFTLLTVNNFC